MAKIKLGRYLIALHPEDIETLKKFYPERGYSAVVRVLVRKFCRILREKEAQYGARSSESQLPTLDARDFEDGPQP